MDAAAGSGRHASRAADEHTVAAGSKPHWLVRRRGAGEGVHLAILLGPAESKPDGYLLVRAGDEVPVDGSEVAGLSPLPAMP